LDTNIQNAHRLLLIKATDGNSVHLFTVAVMYRVCQHLTNCWQQTRSMTAQAKWDNMY